MGITVEIAKEVNNRTVTQYKKNNADDNVNLFNYTLKPQNDGLLAGSFWSENTKAVLLNAIQHMGIGEYSPSILKNDNSAIAKSELHLIDMIKYYEGDRNYYYEAITVPYQDRYGTYTCGFGELTNKPLSQEKAYELLCNKLEKYSDEVRRFLNKKIGKNTYENLPNSVKEGLIDLCYNKGLGSISKNNELLNAIKIKDYSKVVANLAYVHSGKTGASKEEDTGLYRRSLSRLILAARDLSGKEKAEALKEISSFYNKAKKCYEKNYTSAIELDKIYEQFCTGKISTPSVSAESYKIKIDERFKGKGAFSIAKTLYKSLNTDEITFEEFYKDFQSVNKDLDNIKIGQEIKVPYYPTVGNIINLSVEQTNINRDKNNETEKAKEKGGFWNGVKNFFKNVGKAIGNFFKSVGRFFVNLFKGDKDEVKEQKDEAEKTPFQRMLKKSNITQDGDFQIVSMDYEIQKGDNLWKLSREFGISEEILCNNNNIEDKNKINIGQKIKIQKLGYKIEKGDNLFRISQKFGLSQEILKDLNNIVDINMIKAGDMLELPGFLYTVKQGDTLSGIAERVGVSMEILKRINNLQSDTIKPNQKIKVVYNDSDYAVSKENKKVIIDKETNEKLEIIDMSKTANLENRPLLKNKIKRDGQVKVTRKVFEPTGEGALSGKTIIVNAGHGYSQAGTDVGTPGKGNLEDEWLINYDNAMRLKNRLCAKGARVIFLQGHVNIIIKELQKKENRGDLFVSVHVNSCAGKTNDRTQLYTYNQPSRVNNNSKKLSRIMESNFDNWIPKNERISDKDKFVVDNKQDYAQSVEANYAVVRTAENEQKIPAVLWEVAFMASPKGRERMSNPSLMNSYSDIMTKSVEEYFKA